jgi:two-component system, response regulator PdtaR
MNRSLRIAVADDEPVMQTYLTETLTSLGHQVVSRATTGRQLVEQCRALLPDLVISDIKMPDMDGLDAAAQIWSNEPVPIMVVSAYHEPALIERAGHSDVMAYLVKPIKHGDLAPAIAIATRRFEEFKSLQREADDLRQALEDRKMIERAKGIIMKRTDLGEAEAFRRLQAMASEKSRKMVEIAATIVLAEEIVGPGERRRSG